MTTPHILPIASTLSDNYFYLLADPHTKQAALIDPIDPAAAIAALGDLELVAILNTHWHPDHVGGNASLKASYPEVPLIGPDEEAEVIANVGDVPLDRTLHPGDTFSIGDLSVEVLATPGHTQGHVSFLVGEHLFSGDVIFAAGTGHCRLMGDPGVLFRTYAEVLAALPGELTYYPGHDYAKNNLAFALSILPEDDALRERKERVDPLARPDILLATLAEERQYNLFMRARERVVIEALEANHSEVFASQQELSESAHEASFRTLRALRDSW